MIKYASNAFLATKISFINEIAMVCERHGPDGWWPFTRWAGRVNPLPEPPSEMASA